MNSSGISKQVLVFGNGVKPPYKCNVHVHYTGKFLDGRIFDSSVSRGTPFSFQLNSGMVIRGWDMVVSDMTQGEKCMVIIPPEFAYGSQGAGGVIPPNTPLMFEIELLGWN
jgi:FKBP-type peptidyl-prolyl cis-trans isomerase